MASLCSLSTLRYRDLGASDGFCAFEVRRKRGKLRKSKLRK